MSWAEASGACGDLGCFLPLAVGLTVLCGMNFGLILVATGAFNIYTALLFSIPMPVPPAVLPRHEPTCILENTQP